MRTKSSCSSSAKVSSPTAADPEGVNLEFQEAETSSVMDNIDSMDFRQFDLSTKCPLLTSASNSTDSKEGFNAPELDMLQFELEKLLYHAVFICKKYKQLLDDADFLGGSGVSSKDISKKINAAESRPPVHVPQKSRPRQNETGKRSMAASSSLAYLKIKPPKVQKTEHVTISERSAISPGSTRNQLWPQSQIPIKFLNFAEAYLGPLTDDDFQIIHSIIADVSSAADINVSAASAKKKNGHLPADVKKPALKDQKLLKRNKANNRVNKLGSLTEHLIQAMISENPFSANATTTGPKQEVDMIPMTTSDGSIKNFVKSLNMGNLFMLEKLIKQELEEQGIIDPVENSDTELDQDVEDDEVAKEIRQRKKEFTTLQSSNLHRLNEILNLAEKHMNRQNLERDLQTCDDEIMEFCTRFYAVQPSSKKPAKKEKDALWKLLKSREKFTSRLDC